MVNEEIPAQDSYEPWLEVPVDVKDITREFLLKWWRFLRMTRNIDSSYSSLQFSSFFVRIIITFRHSCHHIKGILTFKSQKKPIWRVVWSPIISYIKYLQVLHKNTDVRLLEMAAGCKMRPRHICMLLALWVLAIDSALDPWTNTISPFAIANAEDSTGSAEVFRRSCFSGWISRQPD